MSFERHATSRPAFTFFHVLWFAVSGGIAWFVYFTVDGSLIVRIFLALGTFAVTIVLMLVAFVYIVTAWVIPRLQPSSYWNREVDAFMASVLPEQWGKPPGGA